MRVNGALLGKCVNKEVSMIGTVATVFPDSKTFNMHSSDNFGITVHLNQPLHSPISGLIEVHGISRGSASIDCNYFITFPPELAKTYDAALDNEAINIGFRIGGAWQ